MEITHFSHQHPLILRDDKKNDEYECYACQLPISSGPSYGCTQCKEFVLHKSCVELPKRIEHPHHPQHSLILLHKSPYFSGYICNACRRRCPKFLFVYHCYTCNFDLDIGCASLVLPMMRYEGHEHLLTLFDKIHENENFDKCLCKSCGAPCLALVLRCVECNFNVHRSCADDKSCVELPKQIQHILHPHHPLTPRDHPRKDLRCDACGVEIKNFSFRCEECEFTLGDECTSLAPTIKYEGHHHLLTLFHQFHQSFICKSCECWGDGVVFRCVECDFNLHPHCLPSFPRTIQHKCHETCPLTLTNSVPEDADTDEYYCDACEKERDEDESVYYCADCSFVAHIKCVISEVLPLLNTEQEKIVWPKEVEFGDSSTVQGLLGAGAGDEVLEKGVSAAVPTETVEVEVTAGQEEFEAEVTEDPVIAKLEGENAKLRAENEASTAKLKALTAKLGALTEKLEALTAKLEALESEHAQCVVSKRPSERDKCLSEALTSE